MRNLVLIVPESAYTAVADRLRELDVAGFTVCHVQGHGPHTAEDPFLSERDRVVGFVPQVRVDIVLPSDQVPVVLAGLQAPGTDFSGHGTFWVLSVESFGRL
jgi:nitrogen regulatory protein P-II 1